MKGDGTSAVRFDGLHGAGAADAAAQLREDPLVGRGLSLEATKRPIGDLYARRAVPRVGVVGLRDPPE